MKWNYTCNRFKHVRELINQDIEICRQCMLIMAELEGCCDELTPNGKEDWIFYDNFRDLKSEIHEEIELMDDTDYESCENTVNSYLQEFYDVCDSAKVWLEI